MGPFLVLLDGPSRLALKTLAKYPQFLHANQRIFIRFVRAVNEAEAQMALLASLAFEDQIPFALEIVIFGDILEDVLIRSIWWNSAQKNCIFWFLECRRVVFHFAFG